MPPFNPASIGAPSPTGRGGGGDVALGSIHYAKANPDPTRYVPCKGQGVPFVGGASPFKLGTGLGVVAADVSGPVSIYRIASNGSGRLIAIDLSNGIWTRDNFGLWVKKYTAPLGAPRDVAWAGGSSWVVCGFNCLYFSTDNGDTWSQSSLMTTSITPNVTNGSQNWYLYGAMWTGSTVVVIGFYFDNNAAAYRPQFLAGGPSSFSQQGTTPTFWAWNVFNMGYTSTNYVFAHVNTSQGGNGLYYSFQGTGNWTQVNFNSYVTVSEYHGSYVAAGWLLSAIRASNSTGPNQILFSSNNTTSVGSSQTPAFDNGKSLDVYAILHDGTRFIIVSSIGTYYSNAAAAPGSITAWTFTPGIFAINDVVTVGSTFALASNAGVSGEATFRNDVLTTPMIAAQVAPNNDNLQAFMRVA